MFFSSSSTVTPTYSVPFQYRASTFLCILAALFLLTTACDQSAEEPKTLEFEVTPNDQLRTMVRETPSDFTWEYFGDNLTVSLSSEADWEGELVLSGFKIVNGEVVDRLSSQPHPSSDAELLNGLSSEEVFTTFVPGDPWAGSRARWEAEARSPDAKWTSENARASIELWETSNRWPPSDMETAVQEEFESLGPDTLYVIYAQLAPEASDRRQTSRPVGLLMGE